MKRKLTDFYNPQPAKHQNTNAETAEITAMVSTGITTPTTSAFLEPTMTDGGAITNDIGTVIGKTAELCDYDRLNLLNNAFVPSNDFDWPYQNRTSKGRVEDGISRKNISIGADF